MSSPPFMACAPRFRVSLTYLLEGFSQMTPLPLYLALQVTLSYIKGVLPHVFYTLNLKIVKKLCRGVFVRLESSHSGSYLECVNTSSVGSFTTHLGVPPSPSGMTSLLFPKASLNLLIFFVFVSIPFYIFLLFTIRSSIIFVSFCSSILHLIIITLYLCFSLCSLEVNLHTYLTTWLCSCQVGIFFGFLTIIVNPKIINKSATHKCAILKSTHINSSLFSLLPFSCFSFLFFLHPLFCSLWLKKKPNENPHSIMINKIQPVCITFTLGKIQVWFL